VLNKGLRSEKVTKTVLICHYRVGWTDGVSLEIEKRAQVLNDQGWEVFLLAGNNSEGADFVIDEMDFDNKDIRRITENSFNKLCDYTNEEVLLNHIYEYANLIKNKIDAVLDKLNPDFILLHNIFSHGRHIACAKAFYDVLKERKIPSLATHHDFYWERDHLKQPTGKKIENYLQKYVPPVLPGLRHAVINSIAARKLLMKTGITTDIIPDTFNFDIPQWEKDDYNRELITDFDLNEKDIFILQATRIVKRKGIEIIPPIIEKLNSQVYLNKLVGKTIYNGKKITSDSRFVFLLAGYAEEEAQDYLNSIKHQFDSNNIPYCFLNSQISAERKVIEGKKRYSLFDTYPYSDLISFPSQFEGWGNQFIEGVFAHKPILVFEYPVFKSDIKPCGYHYISLGDEVRINNQTGLVALDPNKISDICEEIVETLLSEKTIGKLDHNYKLAEKNNSQTYLSRLMKWSMEHYEE